MGNFIENMKKDPKMKEYLESEQYQLGNKLNDLRYDYGLDVEDVAEYLGITIEEYVNLENGKTNIDTGLYRKFINRMLTYEEDK